MQQGGGPQWPGYQQHGQAYGYGPPPGSAPMAQAWVCPVCARASQVLMKSEIASSSWVFFFVLLFLCLPLCWVPLLSKQHYRVCASCGARVGLA